MPAIFSKLPSPITRTRTRCGQHCPTHQKGTGVSLLLQARLPFVHLAALSYMLKSSIHHHQSDSPSPISLSQLDGGGVNSNPYQVYKLSPHVDFLCRLLAFVLFLIAMNGVVDAVEARKKNACKYKKEMERAGKWSVVRRV